MDANQVIQLGPVQLPLTLVLFIVGLVIATLINEKLALRKGWAKDQWSDLIISLVLVFIIIYKFGWAIFDLKRVVNNPSSLIWITGSSTSLIMAVFVSLFLLGYKAWKNKYPILDLLDFTWVTIALSLFSYHLFIMDYGKATTIFLGVQLDGQSSFSYHPLNWYRSVIIGLLLLYRLKLGVNIDSTKLMLLYLLMGLGLLTITTLDIPLELYVGFTLEQLAWLAITIIGLAGLLWKK